MKIKLFENQQGQVSRLLLVLAVVVLVAVVITYLVMQMAKKPPAPVAPTQPTVPQPVYESQIGNIRFVFLSALDKGDRLRVAEIVNPQYISANQKDLLISNKGAKFIKVTVGAQNKGKVNIEQNSWGLENIVDDQGREYVPIDGYAISPWIPNPDMCSLLLKPAFDPTPCTRIYEVSKESTGLKIKVETGKDNTPNNYTSGKIESALIDLIVR
jgi:hypothetical protein